MKCLNFKLIYGIQKAVDECADKGGGTVNSAGVIIK
jgi:hypothetical protein